MTKSKLRTLYPHHKIKEELYINFRGKKYFFDFFIPELKIAFECQGKQHFEFVEHFHGNEDGFVMQKRRDRSKNEFCALNRIALVYIASEDDVSKLDYLVIEAFNKIEDDRPTGWDKWIKK